MTCKFGIHKTASNPKTSQYKKTIRDRVYNAISYSKNAFLPENECWESNRTHSEGGNWLTI